LSSDTVRFSNISLYLATSEMQQLMQIWCYLFVPRPSFFSQLSWLGSWNWPIESCATFISQFALLCIWPCFSGWRIEYDDEWHFWLFIN